MKPPRGTAMRLVPVLALALAACAPQSATLTSGDYAAFLASGSSLSLSKETIDIEGYDTQHNIDCRVFETVAARNALQLDERTNICGGNKWPPVHETWGDADGYVVVQEPLDPWRGEAIITSEGDLQIGFHHRLPGGADFRFAFAVRPDFQPKRCVEAGEGVELQDIDGPWIENWTNELAWLEGQPENVTRAYDHILNYSDGRLFALNARSYQLNPDPADAEGAELDWNLPLDWRAGSASGKFAEELINQRATRFGTPDLYLSVAGDLEDPNLNYDPDLLYFCGRAADPQACLQEQQGVIRSTALEVQNELNLMSSPTGERDGALMNFGPIGHGNLWREVDEVDAGLDGWGELHYSYVVFSPDSSLEVGGSVKGAFSILFDAVDSQTRVLMQGEFEVDKVRRDKWATKNLHKEKLIENEAVLCGKPYEEGDYYPR